MSVGALKRPDSYYRHVVPKLELTAEIMRQEAEELGFSVCPAMVRGKIVEISMSDSTTPHKDMIDWCAEQLRVVRRGK